MKDNHIISILESAPLASLEETDMATIRAHIDLCAECRQAYEAARISSMLLKERTAKTVEPSPFFQTRVLAALRERQATQETSLLQRMWKTAGALVSSMVVMVVVLVALTFFAPTPQPPQETAFVPDSDTAAEVLAQDSLSDDEMSYEEVIMTLYEPEEDETK
jgi:hypothetical protein